ncbi:Ulp1 protease [Aphelenchoides avenae]|nr:Ulp1 protease [Aphelenchus avenae]
MWLEIALLFGGILILYSLARVLVPMNGSGNGFSSSAWNYSVIKQPFAQRTEVIDEDAFEKYQQLVQRHGDPAVPSDFGPATPSRYIKPPGSSNTPSAYRPAGIYDKLAELAARVRNIIPGESRSLPERRPPTPPDVHHEQQIRKAASERILTARENYRRLPVSHHKPELPVENGWDPLKREPLLTKYREFHVKSDLRSWKSRKYHDDSQMSKKRAQQLELEARERERARQNREITEQADLRLKLQLEGLTLERPKAVKDDFPRLSAEAEELVKHAWDESRSKGEQFIEGFGAKITRKDLLTLKGLDWLNDEVINFYTSLICERAKNDDSLPKVYAFNTFFFSTIQQRGFAGVKRWTRKIDVFSFDVILVPIHHGAHWCLAVINFKTKRLEYYDSMLGYGLQYLQMLRDYLAQEHQDKKGSPMNIDFTLDSRQDIPRQMNGSDCGMFTCKFAEYASREAEINFDQRHMPYFRKRMVWEICQKELM